MIEKSDRGVNIAKKSGIALLFFGIVYIAWQMLIASANISNPVSRQKLSYMDWVETLSILGNKLLTVPMIKLDMVGWMPTIKISFIICVFAIILLGYFLLRKKSNLSKKSEGIIIGGIALGTVAFAVGYCNLFGQSLPSYQRYFVTILLWVFVYILLRVSSCLPTRKQNDEKDKKSALIKATVLLMSLMLTFPAIEYMKVWKGYKNNYKVYEPADTYSAKITKNLPENNTHDIFFLDVKRSNPLHHRLAYELIGTNGAIRNFYNDTRIKEFSAQDNDFDVSQLDELTVRWSERIQNGGYEYIFVADTDELIISVFDRLECEDVPQKGELYRILYKENGALTLKKVN